MASIIPGYNYDIFISYRQKDNKGDKWVSEFVDALKDELESTFKEEISVYFDINPHDGLLETHDVDESLKEKLKCLVFIPIISRTYCDPKSFAWEHEFKVFVEQASEDQFGLKVKLPGGNVASRVLPIQIHDLDKGDIKLCESVIGGVLRGIEFIYKEPGVNKPLIAIDDEKKNLNNTIYRIQVNKVANAIKDVLNSLTTNEMSGDGGIKEPVTVVVDQSTSTKRTIRKKAREIPSVSYLYKLKNLVTLSRKTWRIIAMVLFVLIFGAFWLARKTAPTPHRAIIKYDIPLTQILDFIERPSIALSPDGEFLVYVMNGELNLKSLNIDAQDVTIPGTRNTRNPFFSPDGKWIGFENFVDQKIMKVELQGGSPILICDMGGASYGISWYENEIIFAVRSAIYRVPDSGGSPEQIYPLNISENDPNIWNPQLLPDKKTLLFSQKREDGFWDIMTWKLDSKENPVMLIENGRDGRYLNSGHIAYTFNNRLYVCEFDYKRNRIISEPQIITTKPIYETINLDYATSQFDFSDNGCLVYYEEPINNVRKEHLVWIDTFGSITSITRDVKDFYFVTVSSDGQNIAADVRYDGENFQIEKINTKLGTSSLFVKDALCPVWSTDNSSIIYKTLDEEIFQKSINLTTAKPLFKLDSAISVYPGNFSKDGRYLTFWANFPEREWDIGYYDMLTAKVEMLEHYNTEYSESRLAISPNGKWLAYESNYNRKGEIYVAPFPGPGEPKKVSVDREFGIVALPTWAPDMTALYYVTDNPDFEIWKVKVQTSGEFFYEEPQSILSGDGFINSDIEIHPDGDRFLAIQTAYGENRETLKVIVNWEQELIDK